MAKKEESGKFFAQDILFLGGSWRVYPAGQYQDENGQVREFQAGCETELWKVPRACPVCSSTEST